MQVLASEPWPWYVAGPTIGLFAPALLIVGNRMFGVSSNLRHMCSILAPGSIQYFRYNWKQSGLWNLLFAAGIAIGGFLASHWSGPHNIEIAESTKLALTNLGLHDLSGIAPPEIFSWSTLLTLKGLVCVILGGFLVGFGTAYAGGCTSGHAISGLGNLELPSLISTVSFFVGGMIATYLILPLVF
jgi:uncharacterized membrane protein YedE/YeeE